MKLLHKVKAISLQWDQSLSWCWLLLVGYLVKFAYTAFPKVDYVKETHLLSNFYPWMSGIPLMDHRNYLYLLGERFFIMILFVILSRVVVCWQTLVLWILEVMYIFDFLFTFHSSGFGTIKMIIMGIMFLLTLIKWKR